MRVPSETRQRDRPCTQAVYPQHPRDSLRFKRRSRPHLPRSTAPLRIILSLPAHVQPAPGNAILPNGTFSRSATGFLLVFVGAQDSCAPCPHDHVISPGPSAPEFPPCNARRVREPCGFSPKSFSWVAGAPSLRICFTQGWVLIFRFRTAQPSARFPGFPAFPPYLSSRPERPDFFMRAELWRVGPRSGGISLQSSVRARFQSCRTSPEKQKDSPISFSLFSRPRLQPQRKPSSVLSLLPAHPGLPFPFSPLACPERSRRATTHSPLPFSNRPGRLRPVIQPARRSREPDALASLGGRTFMSDIPRSRKIFLSPVISTGLDNALCFSPIQHHSPLRSCHSQVIFYSGILRMSNPRLERAMHFSPSRVEKVCRESRKPEEPASPK